MASQSQTENLESEVESETNKSYFTDGFEETIEDNLVDFAIVDQRISLQYQISDKCVFQVECEEEEREQDLSEKYVYTHSDNDSQITDIRNGSKGAEIVNQPNEDDTVINDEVKGNDMEDNEINIATNRNVNTDSVEDGGTKNNLKQVSLETPRLEQSELQEEKLAIGPVRIRDCRIYLNKYSIDSKKDIDKKAPASKNCETKSLGSTPLKKSLKSDSLLSAENQEKLEFIIKILCCDLIRLQAVYDLLRCIEPKKSSADYNSSNDECMHVTSDATASKNPKFWSKSKKATPVSHADDEPINGVEPNNHEINPCYEDNTGDDACTKDIESNLDTLDLDANELDFEDTNCLDAHDLTTEAIPGSDHNKDYERNCTPNADNEEKLDLETRKKRKHKYRDEEDDDWADTQLRTRQNKLRARKAESSDKKRRKIINGASTKKRERNKRVTPIIEKSVCYICGKELISVSSLQCHIKNVHKERDMPCTYEGCKFITKTRRDLRIHLGVMHHEFDAKRFLCNQCGWRGTFPSDLAKHIKVVHEGLRFPCSKCNYQARSLKNLQDHDRGVHGKDASFKCDQCDFVSSWDGALRKHVKFKHESVDKKHKCPSCDRKFTWAADLLRHKQKVHSTIRYPCPECDHLATSVSLYNRHMRDSHGPDLKIPCDECNKTLRSYSSLRCHYRKVHQKSLHVKEMRKEKPVNDFPSPIPRDISLPS